MRLENFVEIQIGINKFENLFMAHDLVKDWCKDKTILWKVIFSPDYYVYLYRERYICMVFLHPHLPKKETSKFIGTEFVGYTTYFNSRSIRIFI